MNISRLLISQVSAHFRGKLSLQRSFWLYLALPSILLLVCHSGLDAMIGLLSLTPSQDIALTWLIILGLWLIAVWQITGVIRAADRYMTLGGDRSFGLGAQGVALLFVLVAIVVALDSYQALQQRTKAWHRAEQRNQPDAYQVSVLQNGSTVLITGSLEVGVSNTMRDTLRSNNAINRVELDSDGGRVYEGRALLKLIRENRLDTVVTGACYSACAIAFLGGVKRTMSEQARLGFHQYRSYTVQPNVIVANEQLKDIELLLEQGVTPEFARAVFTVSSDDLWEPGVEQLRRFGVLTN